MKGNSVSPWACNFYNSVLLSHYGCTFIRWVRAEGSVTFPLTAPDLWGEGALLQHVFMFKIEAQKRQSFNQWEPPLHSLSNQSVERPASRALKPDGGETEDVRQCLKMSFFLTFLLFSQPEVESMCFNQWIHKIIHVNVITLLTHLPFMHSVPHKNYSPKHYFNHDFDQFGENIHYFVVYICEIRFTGCWYGVERTFG